MKKRVSIGADELTALRSDKARLDYLESLDQTLWVGYDTRNGYCCWPVFRRLGQKFRLEVDAAMRSAARYEKEVA